MLVLIAIGCMSVAQASHAECNHSDTAKEIAVDAPLTIMRRGDVYGRSRQSGEQPENMSELRQPRLCRLLCRL